MAIEVPQNEGICGGGKNGGRKGVGSATLRRRAIKGSVSIKDKEQGGVLLVSCWPLHNQSRGQAKKERR